MANNKPIPKTQKQLSEDSREAYLNQGATPSINPKRRELQRSVKNDDVKQFSLGLRDIDEAIFYYFENVIRLSVIRNGKQVNVPLLYGSPERWKAVQKDGFYRDRNGKIMTPLIMIKRDSLEKNRQLGNKLDANNPTNFGIFEKKYSRKNVYDRFGLLSNREPIVEYQGVVIPDFVNITYSCIIFTQYVEQMNKLVESINYASDAYWGDPSKFNFRAMIDNYTTTTEMTQGNDRTIRTAFSITLLGHIVPDSVNAALQGSGKFFSKSKVSFGLETVNDIAEVDRNRYSIARTNSTTSKFYDKAGDSLNLITIEEPMTAEQKAYVSLQKIYSSTFTPVIVGSNAGTVSWTTLTFATPPAGFPNPPDKETFQVFINGLIVEREAIISIQETAGTSPVVVTFDTGQLNFSIDSNDEFTIIGKFN
jgi:hypothetical protein